MAGNWKMHKTVSETEAFFAKFIPAVKKNQGRDIAICPTFPNLVAAVKAAGGSGIGIGGQNLYWEKEGAYTGEVSGAMLKAVGCQYVIIGHSERRQYFGETDETVLKRTVAALAADLTPIVCVGERLEQREAGETEQVLQTQFRGGLGELEPGEFARIVIAYEPVWAIGTGKTATPEIAQEAHWFFREQVRSQYGDDLAGRVRILYGGSVKPNNAKELMGQEDIDGALVGGASLEPDSFASIVNY
jgi:triosephosphate isomerase (TIM)